MNIFIHIFIHIFQIFLLCSKILFSRLKKYMYIEIPFLCFLWSSAFYHSKSKFSGNKRAVYWSEKFRLHKFASAPVKFYLSGKKFKFASNQSCTTPWLSVFFDSLCFSRLPSNVPYKNDNLLSHLCRKKSSKKPFFSKI